ncbi:Aste57867_5836 [Aphanomyces stellatus]|uniref:Aste57867_5836 protein n=1 Tax=Aphanomyces stellatus TaxID=120398 RepID=A0A485KDG0_9STRA|nr:hypothetical protein As57867_005822 [Aphanomyces stellatus]VFT82859.1 Aste57867_5836 [Aphanomyces stellatus]
MAKLASILDDLRTGATKRVVVLIGAGVSTASGIPDFRSPGGMYATLRPELLTATAAEQASLRRDPTGVVSWDMFRTNAFPYLEVRRPFILGTARQTWKLTLAHAFFWVLDERGLLQRVYSQNIDGLIHQTAIARDRIVDVHGTLQQVMCEFCGSDGGYTTDSFCAAVEANIKNIYADSTSGSSRPILCHDCGRAGVKPSTVLYGRSLPKAYFDAQAVDFPSQCDLLVVAGTSLTVFPAAGLVAHVGPSVPRLVVNMEPVGMDLGIDCRVDSDIDAFVEGDCDEGFLHLAVELGWLEDMHALAAYLCPTSYARLMAARKEAGHAGP